MESVSWAVPWPRSSNSNSAIHQRLSSIKPGVLTKSRISSMQQAAAIRRLEQLEAKRMRAHKVVEHAKLVSLCNVENQNAKSASLLQASLHRQNEAAKRRRAASLKSSTIITPRTIPSSTTQQQQKASNSNRSQHASFRLCQRLACIVAKRKLHNTHAFKCHLRVKSVKRIQSAFRQHWKRPALQDEDIAAFFSIVATAVTSFETMQHEYCTNPRVLQAAQLLASGNNATARVCFFLHTLQTFKN